VHNVTPASDLRGLGVVTVTHTPGVVNPADMFTKVLARTTFEKHRKFVMNMEAIPEHGKPLGAPSASNASSAREQIGVP